MSTKYFSAIAFKNTKINIIIIYLEDLGKYLDVKN